MLKSPIEQNSRPVVSGSQPGVHETPGVHGKISRCSLLGWQLTFHVQYVNAQNANAVYNFDDA